MIYLHPLRETRVWKEAFEEGYEIGYREGLELRRAEFVRKCLANGMSIKDIAALLDITPQKARQLAKDN